MSAPSFNFIYCLSMVLCLAWCFLLIFFQHALGRFLLVMLCPFILLTLLCQSSLPTSVAPMTVVSLMHIFMVCVFCVLLYISDCIALLWLFEQRALKKQQSFFIRHRFPSVELMGDILLYLNSLGFALLSAVVATAYFFSPSLKAVYPLKVLLVSFLWFLYAGIVCYNWRCGLQAKKFFYDQFIFNGHGYFTLCVKSMDGVIEINIRGVGN